MGNRNRERRAAKKRRRERSGPEPRAFRHGSSAGTPFDRAFLREAIFAAAELAREPDPAEYQELLTVLSEGGGTMAGRRVVDAELSSVLAEVVRRTWRRGWQPDDLARVVGHKLSAVHEAFVVDAIAADAAVFPAVPVDSRWAGQISGLGAEVWWSVQESHLHQWATREGMVRVEAVACAIGVLSFVLGLPALPVLCDVPGEPGSGGATRRSSRRSGHDPRLLDRVRGLLAKAESTTFAEEAEALSAKAQELMARHAIDEAMVAAAGGQSDAPVGIRIAIDDPYASAKALLLSEVASANGCRSVWGKDYGSTTVLGFEADIDFVEVLYTSLLVQATSAMVATGSQIDRHGRSRTRSFRQSFLVSYAERIGERLRAAEAASVEAAEEVYGRGALLPVLADRSTAVDAACGSAFPGLTSYSVGVTNHAGWAAGAAAAEMASLSGRQAVSASARA